MMFALCIDLDNPNGSLTPQDIAKHLHKLADRLNVLTETTTLTEEDLILRDDSGVDIGDWNIVDSMGYPKYDPCKDEPLLKDNS